ncbi:MAG: prepilin-type N-terminal cleavage/methylation domain-containing protein [Planctomycetes bacterium]|nr:prepilin-type N-terminal cleavage/methylation domain-containing protein [Planctomycetota bacterium]
MTNTSRKLTRDSSSSGFTLIELMVTLMIISSMLFFVLPESRRSQESRDHYEVYTTLVAYIHYAVDIATQTNQTVSLILDLKDNGYYARMDYYPKGVKEDILRQVHYLPKEISFADGQGFESHGNLLALRFDPARAWPVASVVVKSADVQKEIQIHAGSVTIQDLPIAP